MNDKKDYELTMYLGFYGPKKSKTSVPLNDFIKNWKKMEKRNHVKHKFSFTNQDF
jgi:hypothetical protein